METFKMDDRRSTRHLSKNDKGQENSALSYRLFMLAQLRQNNGVMTGEELEAAVYRNYSGTFGPDDLRIVKKRPSGRTRSIGRRPRAHEKAKSQHDPARSTRSE